MASLRVDWKQGRVFPQPPHQLTLIPMVFVPIFLTVISLLTINFIITLVNLSWIHSQQVEPWGGICAL